MQRQFSAAAIVLSFPLVLGAAESTGDLSLDNGVKVPIPSPGYTWQKVRETDAGVVPKVQIYSASKEGTTANVVLIFEQTTADTDAQKLARIKGDYNGMVSSLKDQGYTELKAVPPPLVPPIPDRVTFSITGKAGDGSPAAFGTTIVFGKKGVYHFQVHAGTDAEVKELSKIAETLKE